MVLFTAAAIGLQMSGFGHTLFPHSVFFFALLVSLSHPLRAAVTIPLRREVIDHAIVYPKGALLLSTFVAFKRGRGEATTGTLSLR